MINKGIPELLKTAVYAPSGDNAQPWRFSVAGNVISIFNISDRDETLYNFKQRGSYVGHGALIENICIAAGEHGYQAWVAPFPAGECVAEVHLSVGTQKSTLFDSIKKRSTNRKPYKKEPLGASMIDDIQKEVASLHDVKLKFVTDRTTIDKLAKAISTNERILMEHRGLHDFLFGMIRWDKGQEELKPGLYIKTMEFPPPVQLMMRYVIAHWPMLALLNRAGLSKMIAKQSSAVYSASGAIGAIIIKDLRNESFIEAGRALQRIWLNATKMGLFMQPVTAIPYLMQRIEEGEADMFSPEHQSLIKEAHEVMKSSFGLAEGERIAMLFRIGAGEAPSATSHKIEPIITYT